MTFEEWQEEEAERESIQIESAAAVASSAELSKPLEKIPRQWTLFEQPPREDVS